ncbi:MAG: peptidase U32 [Chloroflexi bacterium]|nr:peptidase U32 [Chloroflexota bacterium]
MKIMLPANYDVNLLPHLKEHHVHEVYGKLPYDVVGGGRPTYMSTPLSQRALGEYVAAVHHQGIEFNYLLNAACLGNQEWTGAFQKRLNRLLDWLTEIEVDTITIVLPYLLQIIKKRYPHFKVKVGIYAQVDTVKRAQYWEDLGVDGINLESFSINRDFEKLARIRETVGCELILIANHFCQPNCPFQIQHQNGFAHASGTNRRFLIDYPLLQCNFRRLSDPTRLISSGWIRPQDLHHYEAIGYHTFKLIERNIPSKALLKRTQAYAQRQFDGNLAELLFSWGFKSHPPRFSWFHLLRTFGPRHIRPTQYGLVKKFLQLQGIFFTHTQEQLPVVIDSSAIPDDFIEHFQSDDCCDRDCAQCGYCTRVAEKAIHIDPNFLDTVLPLYAEIESILVSGAFWGM